MIATTDRQEAHRSQWRGRGAASFPYDRPAEVLAVLQHARTIVETTGAPVALRLTADRPSLVGDGRDAVPIMVETVDSRGRHVPTANFPVTFSVSNGRIIGVGNGDANSHEPEKGDARRLYNGLAQVIVQSQRGSSGLLSLTARSERLKPAHAVLMLKTGSGPGELPVI